MTLMLPLFGILTLLATGWAIVRKYQLTAPDD